MLKVELSKDEAQVAGVKEALKENGGYCPCRFTQTEDTKCMCKEFREQKTPGPCHCGLYVKVEVPD